MTAVIEPQGGTVNPRFARTFVAVLAAALGLSLSACVAQPATIDTAYGVGTAVYWQFDGSLAWIKFADGSVGSPGEDGKGLSFIHHPNGEVSAYDADGKTLIRSWISEDGGRLADGGTTTKEAMATMGEEFTYLAQEGETAISGTPLGVYASSPLTEDDPGQCLLTYFAFQADALGPLSTGFGVSVFAPRPDYVVNSQEMFSSELLPDYDDTSFGLCDSEWRMSGPWQSNSSTVQIGVPYYSAESVYLPEGESFDGIIIGYWDGRRVYYAPTFLDDPLTLASAVDG